MTDEEQDNLELNPKDLAILTEPECSYAASLLKKQKSMALVDDIKPYFNSAKTTF